MQARRARSGSDFCRTSSTHRGDLLRVPFARELSRLEPGRRGRVERELVERFFDGIEKFTPELVSWNGGGFDLPVLHYRALRLRCRRRATGKRATKTTPFATTTISAAFTGATSTSWTCLSGYQARARASLSDTAVLLGFPGKLGFYGSQVWDAYRAGELTRIRRYCETDVINTWLIFLRFQHMRGRLTTPASPRSSRARAPGSPKPTNRT